MTLSSRSFIALLLSVTASVHASAQSSSPVDLAKATLEELLSIQVTTASLTAEGVGTAPARMHVVTAAQIRRRGYRSVADLLKDLSEFKVDLAGDQDYPTELTVQGVHGASRLIVLLNGIRVSSPTNEPLPILANYPVHSARQIEIVYGPASAVYGADAFSGVINIISRDAASTPELLTSSSFGTDGLFNQTASFGGRLGSKATLNVSGQVFYDRQPDLSKVYPDDFAGLNAQQTGTFNTIFGPMTPSRPVSPGYDVPIAARSFEATLRAGAMQVMLFNNESRVSTTPAYTPDNGVYNREAFSRNKLFVAAATLTRPIGAATSTSALTFSRHELDPNSGYWNVYSNLEKSFKYAYGRMIKFDEQVAWRLTPSASMTAGGTVERFFSIPQGADLTEPSTSRNQPGMILGTNIPDEFHKLHYSNAGAFGQLQYQASRTVSMTLGARTDHNTRYGWTFNPRVGIVAQPRPSTTMKVLMGTAYLAPSPYQSYAHYGSFYSEDGGQTYASSYWHLPNPNLKPQRKRTVEVNLVQGLGTYFQVSMSGVFSRFSNLIKAADSDQAYSGTYLGWPVEYIDFPVNEGSATAQSGTAGVDFLKVIDGDRRIEARASLTLADGTVWEGDDTNVVQELPNTSPVQFRVGADVDWNGWSVAPRMAILSRQRLTASLESNPAKRQTLDGYTTVDVTLRRQNVFDRIDAFLIVENAFDRRYRHINARAYLNPEELIGAPQNPRRFTIGFDWRLR